MKSIDGIPDFLRIPQEVRAAAWAARPPRPMSFIPDATARMDDAEVAAFKAAQEEERRMKSLARIAKMKVKQNPVDTTGKRWDSRRNKWVPDPYLAKNTVPKPAPAKVTPSNPDDFDTIRYGLEVKARAAGVWKDSYAKLSNGLFAMTVRGRLKRAGK